MPFQYTFRADDITTWEAETRDLIENRDRELELYSTTIDNSFLNLNASNLTSGTVPSARMTGAYTGITGLGALTSLDVQTTTGTAVRITNTGTGNSFLVEDSASTDATPFVINAAGNVGIGVSSPSNALDVSGNVQITGGSIIVGGSGTFFNTSAEDGIILSPRLGGTGSYRVVFTPTTLSASRTVTLPNATGTMITTGNLSDITSVAATALTGTIASARISGSYTGITGVGTITTGTWSGSFGAVSGVNLTNLNASNLASGAVPGGRVAGSYTGITGVGTLTALTVSAEMYVTGTSAGYGFYDRGATGEYFVWYSSGADAYLYSSRLAQNIMGFARITGTTYIYKGLNMQNTSIDFADSVNPNANNAGFVGFPFGLYKAWAWVAAYNFHTASDIRYKQNIETLPLGINFLRLIDPIKFTYLYPQFEQGNDTPISVDAGTRPRAGLSAQNVRQALDTLGAGDYNFWCLTNKDNVESMQILDYTGFVAPIIQAIKELDQRLQQLETV